MSFDTLAPHYRWMERVLAGQKLQRCRTAFLDKIPAPKRALLVGEGNGRFLTAFITQFPNCEITCLDASAKMLAEAKRFSAPHPIQFIDTDIHAWKAPAATFDLIVTNFFLDCFPADQLAIIIKSLATASAPEATWLLADFNQPAQGWKRWRAQWILASMYLFFRAATKLPVKQLIAPDPFLIANGFHLVDRVHHDWELLHADHWKRAV
jgi:ubiquinone/menaquinone biosynthesis C-methylase UbiE